MAEKLSNQIHWYINEATRNDKDTCVIDIDALRIFRNLALELEQKSGLRVVINSDDVREIVREEIRNVFANL